jgi:hypothetical protein
VRLAGSEAREARVRKRHLALAQVVVAPGQHEAVGAQRQAVREAGGDDHELAVGHRQAALGVVVQAPGIGATALEQAHRVA